MPISVGSAAPAPSSVSSPPAPQVGADIAGQVEAKRRRDEQAQAREALREAFKAQNDALDAITGDSATDATAHASDIAVQQADAAMLKLGLAARGMFGEFWPDIARTGARAAAGHEVRRARAARAGIRDGLVAEAARFARYNPQGTDQVRVMLEALHEHDPERDADATAAHAARTVATVVEAGARPDPAPTPRPAPPSAPPCQGAAQAARKPRAKANCATHWNLASANGWSGLPTVRRRSRAW